MARREEQALAARGPGAEEGPPALLPPPRPLERRVPHQRRARVRPPIRVRPLPVVPAQPLPEPPHELLRAGEVVAPEQLPRQHAEEQLYLVQPRPVDRREVEHVLV